jgi:hypothetical protein
MSPLRKKLRVNRTVSGLGAKRFGLPENDIGTILSGRTILSVSYLEISMQIIANIMFWIKTAGTVCYVPIISSGSLFGTSRK